MPIITSKEGLYNRAVSRLKLFCEINKKLKTPQVRLVAKQNWNWDACAYYRPTEGIVGCIALMAKTATEPIVRNWNWPGNTTDRTPYGVIAHELGHHADWSSSITRGGYTGNFSAEMRLASGEKPISSYCPNDGEWFAEMFRLFITNAALLKILRPRTYDLLVKRWRKVGGDDWEKELGGNCPARIVENLRNKIRKESI